MALSHSHIPAATLNHSRPCTHPPHFCLQEREIKGIRSLHLDDRISFFPRPRHAKAATDTRPVLAFKNTIHTHPSDDLSARNAHIPVPQTPLVLKENKTRGVIWIFAPLLKAFMVPCFWVAEVPHGCDCIFHR